MVENYEGLEGFLDKGRKLETELAGYVGVDSGQLIITDPLYIESEWKKEPYEDIRIFKDVETGIVYQYKKDFDNFQNVIDGFRKSVNELIEEGRLVKVKIEQEFNYSFAGACYATLQDEGYGELTHEGGYEGAAVAFNTFMGDGSYPVYIEKYGGRNIRMYVDLI